MDGKPTASIYDLKLVEAPATARSYTDIALAALDEAKLKILEAEKVGRPTTHVVICLASEFPVDTKKPHDGCYLDAYVVTSECTSDLSALGLLTLCSRDIYPPGG